MVTTHYRRCFGDGRAEYERDANGNPVTFRRPFPFQVWVLACNAILPVYIAILYTHACCLNTGVQPCHANNDP